MKTLYTICSFFILVFAYAQDEFDFDFDIYPDNIQIGLTANDSLWQIGLPQKNYFNEAYSQPNAILTDTVNSYPPNSNASFIFEFRSSWFPYVQVDWKQKTDFEEGVDGGIIEASYDGGKNWLNVLSDTIFRPVVVGIYQTDTLFNGNVGFTGKDDWEWVALCWGTYFGNIPNLLVEPVLVKFTLVSDSVDTQQEGWIMDDFRVIQGAIGSVYNNQPFQSISVYPNPAHESLFINLPSMPSRNASIYILNAYGQPVYSQFLNEPLNSLSYTIPVNTLTKGMYVFTLVTDEAQFRDTFIKLR